MGITGGPPVGVTGARQLMMCVGLWGVNMYGDCEEDYASERL